MKVTVSANWPELGSIENNVWVLGLRLSPGWSVCTLYLSHAMWSYRRRFGSLWLCACSMCDVNCSSAITSYCLLIWQNRSRPEKPSWIVCFGDYYLIRHKTLSCSRTQFAAQTPSNCDRGTNMVLGNHLFWSTCPETNTPEPNQNTQRLKRTLFNQD